MKYIITGRCVDTDGESVDFNRNSCDWYSLEDNSLDCGLFDVESDGRTLEFTASEMCCACAGGALAPVVTTGI